MYRLNENGDVHAMGNGTFLAYGRGGDLIQVFGPPYSSPTLLKARWAFPDGSSPMYASKRIAAANVWQHQFLDGAGECAAESEAFVAAELPVYCCKLDIRTPIRLVLSDEEGRSIVRCDLNTGLDSSLGAREAEEVNDVSFVIATTDTAPIYRYPAGMPQYGAIAIRSASAKVDRTEEGVVVSLGVGAADWMIAGGPTYPEAVANIESAMRIGHETLKIRTIRSGEELVARIQPALSKLGDAGLDRGLRKRVAELCESFALLCTAQQAEDGGIMAGYNYALAYVRDQYGTCRGLLSLGLHEEVRRNLEFRYRKWLRFGSLRNAETMGHDRARHAHENDDVEITAYTIMLAFDYAEASGDFAYLERIFPMLDWCWKAQLPHLHGHMLPFNGDETYVAGGFLPRSALLHGSMEATLLFLEAGVRLVPFARSRGYWTEEESGRHERMRQHTQAHFRANFWRDGGFIANNPQRKTIAVLPDYRYGVCESCITMNWTRRNDGDRYVCLACTDVPLGLESPGEIRVNSAGLLPAFIGSQVVSEGDQRIEIERAWRLFEERGYLPTLPGMTSFVGYDEALLLYGLTRIGHPAAPQVLRHIVDIADTTNAWVEFYDAGKPFNTRCRPWESGMNIAAIVAYMSM